MANEKAPILTDSDIEKETEKYLNINKVVNERSLIGKFYSDGLKSYRAKCEEHNKKHHGGTAK